MYDSYILKWTCLLSSLHSQPPPTDLFCVTTLSARSYQPHQGQQRWTVWCTLHPCCASSAPVWRIPSLLGTLVHDGLLFFIGDKHLGQVNSGNTPTQTRDRNSERRSYLSPCLLFFSVDGRGTSGPARDARPASRDTTNSRPRTSA